MVPMSAAARLGPHAFFRFTEKITRPDNHTKIKCTCHSLPPFNDSPTNRRNILISAGSSLLALVTFSYIYRPLPVIAEEKESQKEDDDGLIGAITSLFDPNEKTKSGKMLPKAYLKSAREVVKTLRESLKEDPKDIMKFRRSADAAKESIRDYLSNWKGQSTIANEESNVMLEKAIRSLANFYSKAGPSAPLPEEIKSEILNDLSKADEFL